MYIYICTCMGTAAFNDQKAMLIPAVMIALAIVAIWCLIMVSDLGVRASQLDHEAPQAGRPDQKAMMRMRFGFRGYGESNLDDRKRPSNMTVCNIVVCEYYWCMWFDRLMHAYEVLS